MDIARRIESHTGADSREANRRELERARRDHALAVEAFEDLAVAMMGEPSVVLAEAQHRWALRLVEQELATL